LRRSFALAALAVAALPALASATPPPPRPVCTVHLTEKTWVSTSEGDVTTPWFVTYC
jgi:hypothetical protein